MKNVLNESTQRLNSFTNLPTNLGVYVNLEVSKDGKNSSGYTKIVCGVIKV